ncbi:hypothetical protein [Bradyrhizobium sp. Ec3.3]|uniref:hypothetical protein n=1 Tax=Bradyrhizobium sp. Ec3.3 TaxID=189753 RepID=UPI0012EC51E7|nr:hypothetical protein [Bradyrhizobium sp. Ec3.3]
MTEVTSATPGVSKHSSATSWLKPHVWILTRENGAADRGTSGQAPSTEILSSEALKKTLLAARAISYSNPAAGGANGMHFAKVLDQFGISQEMQPKTKLPPPGGMTGTCWCAAK